MGMRHKYPYGHPLYKYNRKRRGKLKAHGWTPEMVEHAKVTQSNRCAICVEPLQPGRGTHADHEHTKPPKARELLCPRCNLRLGMVESNPLLWRAVMGYLHKWESGAISQ